MSRFVHLQCHSEFSILEGAIKVKALIAACQEQGMNAVALTDNGTMHGAIDFYVKAKKAGINPILGCELLLTDDISVKQRAYHRLLLLARSEKGYQSLIKLVSIANVDGFYYRPRIDMAHLAQYKDDLVVISPGYRGPIADTLQRNGLDSATPYAKSLKEIFGPYFYIGLQRQGLPFEDQILDGSMKIASELEIPVVATNDTYYLTESDSYLKEVVQCIQKGTQLDGDPSMQSQDSQQYFKTQDEMIELFADIPEAIENTLKIAELCDCHIETEQVRLPRFKCPRELSSEDYLTELVWEGIHARYDSVTDEIKERVNFELEIIIKMHYANYFLITYDFLHFCAQEKIPVGPGRGSAAGSIVAYALDITKIDPIRYKLLFERFLNPERISMPDVDIDFCIRRRGEVIDYIVRTYGEECVSQIITFGTMQARAVVRDVGRVLDINLSDVDRIAKLIPSTPGSYTSIPEALEQIKELKSLVDENPAFQELMKIATKIEGQVRHTSTHAAGVVIARDPLTTMVPVLKNDGQIVTQYPMSDIDTIGLLKMDILGLRNLTVIDDCNRFIREKEPDFDLDAISIDDTATYELLCEGQTVGVFQLESSGMRQLIKDLKPQCFEDIIALLALYRPGPLGSGMVQDFISNKSGETETKYELPELEPILKETYGMIVYQEQVMQIASVIGGFSLGQADMLRRAMGKKKKDVMDEMKLTFLEGAEERDVPAKKAAAIFELCYKFAEYGFNKSHSAAYALISYQTGYLKANYPVAYMAALLSSVLSFTDKVALYMNDCKAMGIQVLPPCVNESLVDFSLSPATKEGKYKENIRFGLGAIKNVGEGAIESMIEMRAQGNYESIFDFCMKVDLKQVNKRVIESLIKSGAMDSLGDRGYLLGAYEQAMDRAQVAIKEKESGMVGLFSQATTSDGSSFSETENSDYAALSEPKRLRYEKEVLGLYISGHPLNIYKGMLDKLPHQLDKLTEEENNKRIDFVGIITGVRRITTKTKKEMIAANLADLHGSLSLLIFESESFSELAAECQEDRIVKVSGRLRYKEDDIAIMCDDIQPMAQFDQEKQVFIDAEDMALEILKQCQQVCRQYKGAMPVLVQLNEASIRTHQKYWVKDSPECLQAFEAIVGAGRVWVA